MPDLFKVQQPGTDLIQLLQDYGIVPPAEWWLSNVITPVSIVQVQPSLPVQVSPTIFTNQTSNSVAALAAATVFLTTGQLAAGDYLMKLWLGTTNLGGERLVNLQWRNAADAANIWQLQTTFPNTSAGTLANNPFEFTWTAALNERFRVINDAVAFAAGEDLFGFLQWRRLS